MPKHRSPWLPDFCRLPRLVAVLGIAELVVVVIALAPLGGSRWSLDGFLSISAFAIWVALTSAVLLCSLRDTIHKLAPPLGMALAVLLPPLVAGFCAWSLQVLGLGNPEAVSAGAGLDFVASSMALAALIGGVSLRYFYVRDQWQAQVQARAKATVDALQARIRPHFLFNSMNSIASLVRTDPVTAERAIEDLADLFRAALGAGEGEATLEEEIALGKRYLAIEQLRLRDRLRVNWNLPDPLPQIRLPRLVLQPLLENAVVHGVARLAQGGDIDITMQVADGQLQVHITNPSLPASQRDASNGHALESIAQRLAYRFGSEARMTSRQIDGYYYCELLLPLP